jgi:hypothetical protein
MDNDSLGNRKKKKPPFFFFFGYRGSTFFSTARTFYCTHTIHTRQYDHDLCRSRNLFFFVCLFFGLVVRGLVGFVVGFGTAECLYFFCGLEGLCRAMS